jgi:NADPH-dependent ferric siderophore reductase
MKLFPFSDSREKGPQVERVLHEVKVRTLRVERTERLTPGMIRITLSGEDLADFVSLAPDDHIKIFVPTPTGDVVRREYTPRRYDAGAKTLLVDFAVHDAGPATRWALNAKWGDTIQVRGPKSSAVIDGSVHRWILVGDETALPAIGRRIEEAAPGSQITSIVSVEGPQEHQTFETDAGNSMWWAYRPLSAGNDPGALLEIVRTIDIKPDTYVWIAAEARVARAVRDYFIETRYHAQKWLKASGYWVAGRADAHEKLD